MRKVFKNLIPFICFLYILSGSEVKAQVTKIRGTVRDSISNEAIAFVNVSYKTVPLEPLPIPMENFLSKHEHQPIQLSFHLLDINLKKERCKKIFTRNLIFC